MGSLSSAWGAAALTASESAQLALDGAPPDASLRVGLGWLAAVALVDAKTCGAPHPAPEVARARVDRVAYTRAGDVWALGATAARVLAFIRDRAPHARRLVLANSEGYWSDDGDFVNLAHKHNFSLGHLGLALAALAPSLTDLVIAHCNDLFGGGAGALATVAAGAPGLRVLRVEEVHCRLDGAALAELAALTDLRELTITAEETMGAWAVGMDAVPAAWRSLTKLARLELRGHTALASLPGWLADLPALTHLDVAGCGACDVSVVGACVVVRVRRGRGWVRQGGGEGRAAQA
jgi:hypothetical protein